MTIRSLPASATAAALAVLLLSPGYAAPEGVHISAGTASPGGTIQVRLISPYPGRSFRILALSPDRHPFPLFQGTTDSSGGAGAQITLADAPGLAGANLS